MSPFNSSLTSFFTLLSLLEVRTAVEILQVLLFLPPLIEHKHIVVSIFNTSSNSPATLLAQRLGVRAS